MVLNKVRDAKSKILEPSNVTVFFKNAEEFRKENRANPAYNVVFPQELLPKFMLEDEE